VAVTFGVRLSGRCQNLDLDQVLALLGVVVAATVLSPTGTIVVLAFALGLVCNVRRDGRARH
jgi:hypothetical protein